MPMSSEYGPGYNLCWSYYSYIMLMKSCLGIGSLEPHGMLDFLRFRLLDMFIACAHPLVSAIQTAFYDLIENLRPYHLECV